MAFNHFYNATDDFGGEKIKSALSLFDIYAKQLICLEVPFFVYQINQGVFGGGEREQQVIYTRIVILSRCSLNFVNFSSEAAER